MATQCTYCHSTIGKYDNIVSLEALNFCCEEHRDKFLADEQSHQQKKRLKNKRVIPWKRASI